MVSEGLKQVITKSCFTAVVVVTALNDPCFLSKAATFTTTNPTPCNAFCIEFHTAALVLLNSIVNHLPGFSTL